MRFCWLLLAACSGGSPASIDASGAPPLDGDIPGDPIAYVAGDELGWYRMDLETGALAKLGSTAAFQPNPNFLATSGTSLYAVTSGDRVGAYSIDPGDFSLRFINDVSSGGSGPAHVAFEPSGFVLVANYSNGVVSVHATREDGGIGESLQRHDVGANAHQVVIRAAGAARFVFVPCLGVDHVAQFEFDQSTGNLTPNTPPVVTTANGAGPRHLAFAPVREHAYLINELDSTLTALAFDGATGVLTPIQTITTRAAGASGNNTTAEVVVHGSGKFVYGSNRGDDNIVAYRIDALTGMVTLVGHTSTQGMTPRNFTIDPSGRFLYAANQGSDSIVVFAIDPDTGALTPTGGTVTVGSPAFIGFTVLPR